MLRRSGFEMHLEDLKPGDKLIVTEELSLECEEWLEANLYTIKTHKVPPEAVITFCGYRAGPGREPFSMGLFQYGKFTGYLRTNYTLYGGHQPLEYIPYTDFG
jgi:hypothetical protein